MKASPWTVLVLEHVSLRAKYTCQLSKFLAPTHVISVFVSEETSSVCNKVVHLLFQDVGKKLFQGSVAQGMNVLSKEECKMSQSQLQKSLQLLHGSLVIKILMNQVRSRSKSVAVRSRDISMKSVPLLNPRRDLVSSAGKD